MKRLLAALIFLVLLLALCLCSCQGADGLTPKIGENGNWWIGDTDTGVSASGSAGDDGDDGLTPSIGENGNWWIGDTDMGASASGADGLTPKIGENGNWWIGEVDTGVGARGEDLAACVHSYTEWETVIAPSCTSIGYSSRVCSLCEDVDYSFAEAEGHVWAEDYSYELSSGDLLYTCGSCGAARIERAVITESSVTLAELREANDRQTIVSVLGAVLVRSGSGAEIYMTYDEDTGFTADMADGGDVINVQGGAAYTLTESGEAGFMLIPDVDFDARSLDLLLADPLSFTQSGSVLEWGSRLVLVTEHSYSSGGYTCYFDKNTLLMQSFTARGQGAEETYTFTYAEERERNTAAYDALTSGGMDSTELCFVIDPGKDGESERRYTILNGANFAVMPSASGDAYKMYMNYGCTVEIPSLSELISADNYSFVYVYVSGTGQEISFEYTLSASDTEEFEALCDALVDVCLGNRDVYGIISALEKMIDKLTYFSWQSQVGQVLYGIDASVGRPLFEAASAAYDDAYHGYIACLKEIYESDAAYAKAVVFSGWSADDFEVFETDTSELSELESANSALTNDAYVLVERYLSGSVGEWDYAGLDAIYTEMVANYQAIAEFYGYADYYGYASAEIYGRDYTAAEREAFRSYVKEYIVPLYTSTYARFYELLDALDNENYNLLHLYMLYSYFETDTDYIGMYIDSYGGELHELMNGMMNSPSVIFDSEGASPYTAFVGYSRYYETPYAFFSYDYQDMMTIVHEMGHYVSRVHLGSSELSMDVKEIHSQGNEWLYLVFLADYIDEELYEAMTVYHLLNSLDTIIHAALVDEFEERVYTALTPVTDFAGIAVELAEEYGGWDFLCSVSSMDPYMYIQYVATQNPLYYLSYATSGVASLGFYVLGAEDYEGAQEAYRLLQEEIGEHDSFGEIIEAVGLYSPFDIETYIALVEFFELRLGVIGA